MTRSVAELFESASRMHDEQGSLDLLRYQLGLSKDLHEKQAAATRDLNTFTIQERSKKEQLDSIEQATEFLRQRAERAAAAPRLGAEQIQPMIAKSEMLLNEISRLREKIAQGELRSPVNGTVLRRHHPAGECNKSHEPLFSVMLVPCQVTSIGTEHRRPPENIEIYYRSSVRLLPIRLKPLSGFSGERKLSVGSIAKLPHFGTLL